MALRNRLLVAVAVISSLLGAGTAAAHAQTTAAEPPPPVSLGTPLQDVLLIGGTVGTLAGDTVIWSASSGLPAYLNAVDPDTGASLLSLPLTGASGSYAVEQAADGTVYVGTYGEGRLYRLRPGASTVDDLGVPAAGESFVLDLVVGDDGKVYSGTYPSGKIVSYDPASGAFHDYGTMIAGQTYVKSITSAGGKIYGGAYVDGFITELDPATGAKRVLPTPPGVDVRGKVVNDLNARGGKLYARLGTAFPSPLHVYDIASGTWVDTIELAAGLDVSPPDAAGKVYLFRQFAPNSAELVSYDPATKAQVRTGLTIYGRVTNTRGIGWADLTADGYPGPSIVGLLWRGTMFRYNPQTGNHATLDTGVRREPTDILSLAAGPRGTAYAGGFLSGGLSVVDLASGEAQFNRFSQLEQILPTSNGVWLGAYPDARIYRYDPSLPWNSPDYSSNPPGGVENPPKVLDLIGHHQNRPQAMTEALGKVVVGTVPSGDRLGGSLAVIDMASRTTDVVIDNLITDESIVSAASRGGVVYGSTSVFGGLATTPPTQAEATVFAFDVRTRQVLWQVNPEPGLKVIPAVTVDRDGMVWTVTGNKVRKLDPKTGRTVGTVEVAQAAALYTAGQLTMDGRGVVYALVGGKYFVRIQPGPARGRVILEQSATKLTWADNRLIFSRGATLYAWTPPAK